MSRYFISERERKVGSAGPSNDRWKAFGVMVLIMGQVIACSETQQSVQARNGVNSEPSGQPGYKDIISNEVKTSTDVSLRLVLPTNFFYQKGISSCQYQLSLGSFTQSGSLTIPESRASSSLVKSNSDQIVEILWQGLPANSSGDLKVEILSNSQIIATVTKTQLELVDPTTVINVVLPSEFVEGQSLGGTTSPGGVLPELADGSSHWDGQGFGDHPSYSIEGAD